MADATNDQKALLQKAILEIRELRAKLRQLTDAATEPIAIIGASCRFPGGANSLDEYWQLLIDGREGITEVPAERWDAEAYYDQDPDAPGKICSKRGGFLDLSAYAFDAAFFGISPREAESLDPQQRLLMELCWEAIEHGNILHEDLFKSNTGVFIGVSSLDNATRIIGEAPSTDIDGYYGTGIALAPAAGRISYHFGLTGPSYVVDTACSSSLLSLHLACESLRRGECTMALAGGVQLLTHPGVSIAFTKARMLSPDGRCKTFDDDANGYVRGEGGGVMLLKKLSAALHDGDRVLAVIRGSAVNQDGASGGLTVPSGPSQEAVIRRALEQSGLAASDISYIEAHGTGTPLGDPIEIGALTAVYGAGRRTDTPLRVGSVKTNIGHLEASAGIASAIKAMLSLRHGKLAPSLHYHSPNKLIPWGEIPIRIQTEPTDWHVTGSDGLRAAGVSSFGFSGTNVHLIMQEALKQDAPTNITDGNLGNEQLLVISARTKSSLIALAKSHSRKLQTLNKATWPAYANTAATKRTAFRHRLALASDCPVEASKMLQSWISDSASQHVVESVAHDGVLPKVLMLFSGQGSQYVGMGKSLYERSAVFRAHLDQCDSVMQPSLGFSVKELLFSGEYDLDLTENTQPALFALELALAETWKSYGGTIDGVIGHSVGEYAAAVVAGVLSLEDAAKLIILRGRLMQQLPQDGGMIAIFTHSEAVGELLGSLQLPSISVAAVNAQEHVVVSGQKSDLEVLIAAMTRQGVDFRELRVSHAFHSSLMEPMLHEFEKAVRQVTFHKPKLPFFTNLTGALSPDLISTPEYWVRQIREAVLFNDAFERALKDEYTLVVEAGPKSTLIHLARTSAGSTPIVDSISLPAAWSPLLGPTGKGETQFISTLGTFWCQGGELAWDKLASGITDLPLYAFDRAEFRKEVVLDAVSIGSPLLNSFQSVLPHRLMQKVTNSPLLDAVLYESEYRAGEHSIFRDHLVFGQFVVAGAAHLSLTVAAAQHYFNHDSVQLKEVLFPQALVLPTDGARWIHLSIGKAIDGASPFKLISGSVEDATTRTHAQGKVATTVPSQAASVWRHTLADCPNGVDPSEVYDMQRKRHIQIGGSYRWLQMVRLGSGVAYATLEPPAEAIGSGYGLHPGLIDSCFGLLALTTELDVEETFIPFGVASVKVFRLPSSGVMHATARMTLIDPKAGKMVGDITVESELGEVLIKFEGMEGRKASATALLPEQTDHPNLIYDTVWTAPSEVPAPTDQPDTLLVLIGDDVAPNVTYPTQQVVCVGAYREGTNVPQGAKVVDPADSDALDAIWSTRTKAPEVVFVATAQEQTDPSADKMFTTVNTQRVASMLEALSEVLRSLKRCGIDVPVVPISVVPSTDDEKPHLGPPQAAMHAFLRSIRKEQDVFSGAEVYVESGVNPAEWLPSISSWNAQREQVWIQKDGVRYARLSHRKVTLNPTTTFDEHGIYLITGGFGSLARHLVDFLSDHGAKEFILVVRTRNESLEQELRELSGNRGTQLHIVQADVSDRDSLEAAFTENADAIERVKGVFHLAGVSHDVNLEQLTGTHLLEALKPKVEGLANLLALCGDKDLDHLVVYSSVASLLGNAGQAAYSAANAATEALLTSAAASGLPASFIQWGPWQNMGMMSRLGDSALRYMESQGIGTITPSQANTVLASLLVKGEPASAMVASIDWNLTSPKIALSKDLTAWEEPIEAGETFKDTLSNLPARQRSRAVMDLLNELLTHALRLPLGHQIDPNERLFDLGVDSLIAIELKNKLQAVLQRPVSSTLLFDYPTLDVLTKHILQDLIGDLKVEVDNGSIQPVVSGEVEVLDIDSLSEEAAEEELLKALNQMQGLKGL